MATMTILKLENFSQRCRLCLQEKQPDAMVSLGGTLIHDSTLELLLENLLYEVPKRIARKLPASVCQECATIIESVSQYRQQKMLLLKFLSAFIEVGYGNRDQLEDMLSDGESSTVVQLLSEMHICDRQTIDLGKLVDEYDRYGVCDTTVVKREPNGSVAADDVYYEVEYIDDASVDPEPVVPGIPMEMLKVEEHDNILTNRSGKQWLLTVSRCDGRYGTEEHLGNHKREVHSNYVCDICGKQLKHKYSLDVHLRRHSGYNKHKCSYCSNTYVTKNELKLHISVMHMIVSEWDCATCGLKFKNKKSLAIHEKMHSEQRNFHCETCGVAFKTQSHLQRHTHNVHLAIKFTCKQCGTCYGRKDKLRMHMERAHQIQSYFDCDICLKSFSDRSNLEKHKEHHDNPKHLECGVCLAAFLNNNDYKDHLCITYRSDYVCCNRDYKHHNCYNKHMFLVHGKKTNVRVKPFTDALVGCVRAARKPIERCPKCEKTFPTRTLKLRHISSCLAVQRPRHGSPIYANSDKC